MPDWKEESFPDEPEKDCGVDPFTGSGKTFAQESGFNTYTITSKNTAPQTASRSVVPGETLSCTSEGWGRTPDVVRLQVAAQ